MPFHYFSELLHRAKKAADEGNAVVAVVMGQTAVESYLNSAVESAISYGEFGNESTKFGRALQEAERLPIRSRIELAYVLMTGSGAPWDRDPFQSFLFAKRLRDELVHNGPKEPLWLDVPLAGTLRNLESRGLIDLANASINAEDDTRRGASWFSLWQTEMVAQWAAKTAGDVIRCLGEAVPDSWHPMLHDILKTPHSAFGRTPHPAFGRTSYNP